jgi:hypothetical protein
VPGVHIIEQLDDASVCAGSDYAVYFGNELLELFAVSLRETTRDDELLTGRLALRVLENDFRRLRFGRIDERARVDNNGVGFLRIGRKFVSSRTEFRDHHLGVDEIFCAAQTNE